MIQLYNQDCMVALKDMPDKAFDLAIVDPPYGINMSGCAWFGLKNDKKDESGKARGEGVAKPIIYKMSEWDNNSPDENYFRELFRVSRNQIIWGANHFINKIPFPSSCWIVWDKQTEGSNFADCELAWTSFKTTIRKFTFMWRGMLQGDMKNKEIRVHQTQKPVKLYEWLLTNYAKHGQRILDTHLGSGSSAIAAHNLGFNFVGIELDPDYYAAACKRLEQHKAQGLLFIPSMKDFNRI